jgi:hypothetical protein
VANAILIKQCTKCKSFKSLSDFYAKGKDCPDARSSCKTCAPKNRSRQRKYIPNLMCNDCGASVIKRDDQLKSWTGYCRSCATKHQRDDPTYEMRRLKTWKANLTAERRQKMSARAKEQVIQQGGIPNAGSNPRYGLKNNQWRGGIATTNRQIRSTLQYKNWHKAVLKRDDYTCQHCGKRGGRLEVDHILPFSTHVELRFELSNGRTLCPRCHRATPTYGGKMHRISKVLQGAHEERPA